MDINSLFVIAYKYDGRDIEDGLVTKKVYASREDAEKNITNNEIMVVIDLERWGKAKWDSGYVYAYG